MDTNIKITILKNERLYFLRNDCFDKMDEFLNFRLQL